MSFTATELERVGAAEELQIAVERRDGTLRDWVPIWVVRVADDLYVRSYRGTAGVWYRHAVAQPHGRIRAGGLQREVTFAPADDGVTAAIDDAYRAKYARYGDRYLQPMLTSSAIAATLRLTPLEESSR
jgi:hypothetical protein